MTITTVGLDADDTLWHSETYFSVTEERFRALLTPWCEEADVAGRLLERERVNLEIFGYGIKGFTLSMVETAIEASDGAIPTGAIQQIIQWGKEMLTHPVELLPGVTEAIDALHGRYRLALITKGDLFHQESKIAESGLAERFESINVLAEKNSTTYGTILSRLGVQPRDFAMVGNSVRSDVLPLVELGAHAVHIPYAITWNHEVVDDSSPVGWASLGSISELPGHLETL